MSAVYGKYQDYEGINVHSRDTCGFYRNDDAEQNAPQTANQKKIQPAAGKIPVPFRLHGR